VKLWIGVDADGSAWAYRLKPKWHGKLGDGCFVQQRDDSVPVLIRGKNKACAGKCWQQEIVPPSAKKRGSAPSSEPQTEWWDNKP